MAPNTSRTMIAALQVPLDGFVEGPNGEKDWVDSWADAIKLIPDVDMFILGGRMTESGSVIVTYRTLKNFRHRGPVRESLVIPVPSLAVTG